ncbi:MAG: hypothetical protein M1823_006085 [Watsoniomyces obsoletus]|nr:MAG: hypothetical protein M1823_006085 [Watsoniomyces obsoletus]
MLSHRLWLLAFITTAVSGIPLLSDDITLVRRSAIPEQNPGVELGRKEDVPMKIDPAAWQKQEKYTAWANQLLGSLTQQCIEDENKRRVLRGASAIPAGDDEQWRRCRLWATRHQDFQRGPVAVAQVPPAIKEEVKAPKRTKTGNTGKKRGPTKGTNTQFSVENVGKGLSTNYHASVRGASNAVKNLPQNVKNFDLNWAAMALALQQGALRGVQSAPKGAFVG